MIRQKLGGSIIAEEEDRLTPLVYVVEDDTECRNLISAILTKMGFSVSGFESGEAFLSSINGKECGCVILGHNLPGLDGCEILKATRTRGIPIPFVVVSGVCTVPLAVEFMKLGAETILEKPFRSEKLIQVVTEAIKADCDRGSAEYRRKAMFCRMFRLTPREREILSCILSGMITKQIAKRLNISPKTVEVHRSSVVRKLEAESMLQIIQNLAIESPLEDNV
jgi:two-component system response regulator FixJ